MTASFTLIAVHGNGGGGFRFALTAPHMPPSVRFAAPTLPGFSDAPRNPGLQSMRDYALHLAALLGNLPRPLVLLGHGVGGAFALELIQHQPDAADAILLHAPVGARLDRRRFPKLMRSPRVRALGQWLFAARVARPLWRRALFSAPVPPDYLKRFFDEYRRCAVFSQMFDLITAAWFNGLRPVPIRAGLLWGARERVLRAEQAEDYKALLPRHMVRIVPEWDHFPMIEQPADYAREVVRFSEAVLRMM